MRSAPDSRLIEGACQGDAEAIQELLRQHHPALRRFARQYCATPQDVEDAVQETLWQVYQHIGTLRSAAAFVSWSFAIVRNSCYHLLKRLRRLEIDDLDDVETASCAADIDLRQDIASAIARLPAPYREVLLMRDVEGRSTPETAAALALSSETVKSRLHRARLLLREALA